MPDFNCPFVLALLAWIVSLATTALALYLLKRYAVMDTPNSRSNHAVSVPRGGGIAMIATALLFMTCIGAPPAIVIAALLLAAVSFTDDLKNLPVRIRLLAQFVAVVVALYALPGQISPDWIPLILERVIIIFAWLWFINLTNFMDGIDGITSMQAIVMCVGICLLRVVCPALPVWLGQDAAIIAASVFGFYAFNRSPAKLFMGDAGSVPLGFLLGYLLISLATQGAWIAALILPAYYLSDATFTLLIRARKGEKIWQAHSQHAYQQAVRAGMSHHAVVSQIAMLNLVLVALAMLSTLSMMAGLGLLLVAYFLTACLIWRFIHVSTAQ